MGNTVSSTRSQAKTIQPDSLDQNLYKEKNKTDPKVKNLDAHSLINRKTQPETISPHLKIQNLNEELNETCRFDLLYQKARCLIVELDRFEEGLEECQNLLTQGEDRDVHILMAMAYLGLGQTDNGERTVCHLRNGQLNKRQDGIVKLLEAEIAFQKKEYTKALSLAEQVRKRNDSLAAESIITQAKVFNAQNNEEQDYKCLSGLIDVNFFDSVLVYKSLLRAGELHVKNKQVMKAGACFFEIIFSQSFTFKWTEKIHTEPLALFSMQDIKKKMQEGNYTEAGAYSWHILKILPDASWAYVLFLECMEHLNRQETYAEEPIHIEHCLNKLPGNPWLHLKIADLQAKDGFLENVWGHYQVFLKKFPDSPFIFEARLEAIIESLIVAYVFGEVKFDQDVIRNCLEKLRDMSCKQQPRIKVGMYACTLILYGLEEKLEKKLTNEINSLAASLKKENFDYIYYLYLLLATSFLRNNKIQKSNQFFSIIIKIFITKDKLLCETKKQPIHHIFCALAWIQTSLYLNKTDIDFRLIVNKILEDNQKNAYAHFINGLLYAYEYDEKKSLIALDTALALNPYAAFAGEAYYYKAMQQLKKNIEAMLSFGKKALDLGCTKGVIPYSRALAATGKYKEAAYWLEKHETAIEENLTPELLASCSKIFCKLGNFQKPIDLCSKAIKANQESEEVNEYISLLADLIERQDFWNFCEMAELLYPAWNSVNSNDLRIMKNLEQMKKEIMELPRKSNRHYPKRLENIKQLKDELAATLEFEIQEGKKIDQQSVQAEKSKVPKDIKKTLKEPEQETPKNIAIPRENKKSRSGQQPNNFPKIEPPTATIQKNEPDAERVQALYRKQQTEKRIEADQWRKQEKLNLQLDKDQKPVNSVEYTELDQILEQMPAREREWFAEKKIGKKQSPPTSLPPLFVEYGHPHNFIENEAKKKCLDIVRKESVKLFRWVQDSGSKEYIEALAEFRAAERRNVDNCEPSVMPSIAVPYKKQPLTLPNDVKGKKGPSPVILTDWDLFIIRSAKLACVSLKDALDRKDQVEIFKKDKETQTVNSLLYNMLKLFDFLNDNRLAPALAASLHKTFLHKETINQARNAIRHNFFAIKTEKVFQLAETLIEGKAKERLDSLSCQKTDFQIGLDLEVLKLLPSSQELTDKTSKDYFDKLNTSLKEFACLAEPFRSKFNREILEQDSDSLHALKMTVAKMCECLRQLKIKKKGILSFIIKSGNRVAHEKGDNPFNFEDMFTNDVCHLIEQTDSIIKAVYQLGRDLK